MPQNVNLYRSKKKKSEHIHILRASIESGNQFCQDIKTNTVANFLYLKVIMVGF